MAPDLVQCAIVEATPADVAAIAALHAESWRQTYRGLLPDRYLDAEVIGDRRALWAARAAEWPARMRVLKAAGGDSLYGFACVWLDDDPRWGALLDNLHVQPDLKRQGVGARLLAAAREQVRTARPGQPMHLLVFEANTTARRFYERHGGMPVERLVSEVLPGVHVADLRYQWCSP